MEDNNNLILTRLSSYLNNTPDYISENMIKELTENGITAIEAVRILLASILNLYDNKEIINPFIYKIYYYSKTNLYYLNSRYNWV